jgi:hypothetical protein
MKKVTKIPQQSTGHNIGESLKKILKPKPDANSLLYKPDHRAKNHLERAHLAQHSFLVIYLLNVFFQIFIALLVFKISLKILMTLLSECIMLVLRFITNQRSIQQLRKVPLKNSITKVSLIHDLSFPGTIANYHKNVSNDIQTLSIIPQTTRLLISQHKEDKNF